MALEMQVKEREPISVQNILRRQTRQRRWDAIREQVVGWRLVCGLQALGPVPSWLTVVHHRPRLPSSLFKRWTSMQPQSTCIRRLTLKWLGVACPRTAAGITKRTDGAVKRRHLHVRSSLCILPLSAFSPFSRGRGPAAARCLPGLGAIPCLARSRSLRHVHVPSAFLLALLILPRLRAALAHTAAGRAPRVVGAWDSCGSSASERASSGDGALVLPDSSGNNLEDPWCGDDHADDDPDEPYLQDWPEMPISPTTYLDSDDSSYFVFNADWSIARRQIRAYLEKQEAEEIARRSAAASMAAEESRRIPHNVAFTVSAAHMRHRPGCRVVVCGGHNMLGQWRPSQGLELHTTPETFPLFSRSVYIEAPARLEYRYALVVGDAVHPTADSADDLPSSEADCDASSGADGSFERRGADVDGPSLESNEAGLEVQWEAKSRHLVVPEGDGGAGGGLAVEQYDTFVEDRQSFPRLSAQSYQMSAQVCLGFRI